MNWIAEVKNEIGKGKISKALVAIAQNNTDEDIEYKLIALSSRWNKLAEDEMLGILSNGDIAIERSKITQSLLSLIKEIPQGQATSSPQHFTNPIINNGDGMIIIQGNNSKIEIKKDG